MDFLTEKLQEAQKLEEEVKKIRAKVELAQEMCDLFYCDEIDAWRVVKNLQCEMDTLNLITRLRREGMTAKEENKIKRRLHQVSGS